MDTMRAVESVVFPVKCDERCAECSAGSGHGERSELEGARLAGWAAAVFLLPIITAALGAVWAGGTGARALVGAVAGGIMGAASVSVALAWSRRRERSPRP